MHGIAPTNFRQGIALTNDITRVRNAPGKFAGQTGLPS
jgi:hypothetical protein